MTTIEYSVLLDELRSVLAQERKWNELPYLLDQLDRVRLQAFPVPADTDDCPWDDRFTQTLLEADPAPDVARAHVEETARVLWPWMGDQDPVALAHGQWESLPRSYG